jgi:hypothetical protein
MPAQLISMHERRRRLAAYAQIEHDAQERQQQAELRAALECEGHRHDRVGMWLAVVVVVAMAASMVVL